MVKQWKRDMRYSQNNSVYAAGAFSEVLDAKEQGDLPTIQNIRIMREAWDRVPGMFSKGGDNVLPALYENIEAGVLDPLNVVTGGAGALLAPAKSMAVKVATAAAIDAITSAGIDYGVQKTEIELDFQKDLDEGRMAVAGTMGAVIPGTITGALYMGSVLKNSLNNIFVKRSANLANMPLDAKNFDQAFKDGEEADALVKGISFIGNKNSNEPWKFIHKDTGKEYQVGGSTKIFTSQADAIQWAEQHLIPNAQPGSIKATDLIEGSGTTSTPWRMEKLHFKTIDDARNFVKDNGHHFGSKSPDDYTYTSNEVAGVEGGMMQPIGLKIQQHVDRYYRIRQIWDEAKPEIMKRHAANPQINRHFANVLAEDPLTMAENAQNSNYIAASFVTDGVFQLAPDPNNPNAMKYTLARDTPALGSILVDAGNQLRARNVTETNYANEIMRYMVAKRVVQRESNPAKPINTGFIVKNAKAYIEYIENDPNKSAVYTQAATQIQAFNKSVMQFLYDHSYISADHMQKMLTANDMFMPFRKLETFQASFFDTQKGGAADTTRKYLTDEEKIRGRAFLDPLEAYKQELFAVVNNAVTNRAKLQMYRSIEAAGGHFANRFIQRQTGAHQVNISPTAIQRALKTIGINIQVNQQNAPMLAVWVKEQVTGNKNDLDFVYENGKPVFYKVKDLLLKDAVVASGPTLSKLIAHVADKTAESWGAKLLQGGVGKAFRSYNEVYSTIITHDPGFLFGTAMVTDAVAAYIFNPRIIPRSWSQAVTDIPFINAARGFSKSMDTPEYKEFMANGGGLSGMRANISAKDLMIRHAKTNNLDPEAIVGLGFDSDSKLLNRVHAALFESTGFGTMAKKSENAVRYNTYVNDIAGGKTAQQAGNMAAKSSIDFRLRGTSLTSTQLQRTLAPFTRAMLNALYQTNRRLFTEGKDSAARLAKLGVVTVPFSVFLHYVNQDDPQYEAINDHAKDMYWFVPVGEDISKDGFLKIRKPHELAIPANAVQYYLRELEKSEEGRATSKLLGLYVAKQIGMSARFDDPISGFLPPPLATMRQILGNTVGGGIPLNAARDEGNTPSERGVRPTVRTWLDDADTRAAIDNFNSTLGTTMTPKDVEVLIGGLFGVIGRYSMDVADTKYELADGTYKFHFSSLPIINRIYQSGRPVRSTGLDDRIFTYDKYVTRLTNDIKLGTNYGRVSTIEQAIAKLENVNEPKYQKYMEAAKIIEKVSAYRNDFEKKIVQTYIQGKENKNPRTEDEVDELFKDRNEYLAIQVKLIEDALKKRTKANDK